jgi:AcrR family transcriptional regulator
MPVARKSRKRLSREDWLEQAMQVFAKDGQAGLRIQGLCAELGVSRGSFYWHFEDREDFIHALLEYWHVEYTTKATRAVDQEGGTAEEKLAKIIHVVHDRNLTRYDLVIRAFAVFDPGVARSVRKTDRHRLGFLEGLFCEMGFSGVDMEVRAKACLTFMTLEHTMYSKLDAKHRDDLSSELAAFLVRP